MMNTRMVRIPSTLQSAMKGIHTHKWIALVCLIPLLVITVLPDNVGRSESEIYLCFFIPFITLVGLLSALIRKVSFRVNWIDALVVGWYSYTMIRFWGDATYPASGFAIEATLMYMLYVALRLLLVGCRLNGKHIAVLLIIFSAVEAAMGYSQLISGVSRHHLYPVTGSFLNPGPYSAYLCLGMVSVFGIKKLNDLHMLVVTFIAVPLLLTMSRVAFLALFICVLIVYRDKIRNWRQWVILIAITVICCIGLYLLKSRSADGRGIINYIGIQCLIDKPFWGNGIGSFFHSFACKTAEISMQNPDADLTKVDVIEYAFNDLLLVGVEQGLVGLSFAFGLIAMVMYRLWKECKSLFLSALSLLIISLFSYPFELLPYQMIGVIIAAYSANICKAQSDIRFSNIKTIIQAIAVLLPMCWISHICHMEIKERLDAENGYRMMARLKDPAFTKDFFDLLPMMQENRQYLFDFAMLLSRQGRYNDSNEMLRRGALISNDPMFLVLQGNNYRDLGAYDLANQTYLKAWHTIPNRLYPIYQLMKLNEQSDNMKQAVSYAQEVINFKEKIKSPAVNEMKKEAKELIEHER